MGDTRIEYHTVKQLQHFVKELAPGLHFSTEHVDMFDTEVIRIGARFEKSVQITDESLRQGGDEVLAQHTATALAELQKEIVSAIGLESYVREREVAVLELAKERLSKFVEGALGLSEELATSVATDLTDEIRNDLGAA